MADETPQHIAWPFRVENGTVATTDEDSPEEITDCVVSLLRTPLGHLPWLPDYGRPPQWDFRSGGVPAAEVRDLVESWEDRADPQVTTPDPLISAIERIEIREGPPNG